MPSFTDPVKFRKRLEDVQTPTWYTLGQLILGILFLLLFAWVLLSEDEAPTTTATPPVGERNTAAPSQSPTTTGSPTATPTTGSGTVSVEGIVEDNYSIPGEAFALATLTGKAHASVDAQKELEGKLFQGTTFSPHFAGDSPDVVVGSILVNDEGGGAVDENASVPFIVEVDPDGEGPEASYFAEVLLVKDNSAWKVASA